MRTEFWLPALLIVIVAVIVGLIVFMPGGGGGYGPAGTPNETGTTAPGGTGGPGGTSGGLNEVEGGFRTVTQPSEGGSGGGAQSNLQGMNPEAGNVNEGATVGGLTTIRSGSEAGGGETGGEGSGPQAARENRLAGVVQNSQGQPVQGARVTAQGIPAVVTDGSGNFHFRDLTQETVTLTVAAEGYQTLTKPQVPAGELALVLVLVKNGGLAGRVIDQYDDPIPFANVSIRALRGVWLRDLRAGADGRFAVNDAPEGRVQVTAGMEGFTDNGQGSREVESPSPEEIVLRLSQPSYSISGVVARAEDGQGVSNFHLMARKQDEGGAPAEVLRAVTGAGGAYRFESLKPGTYLVSSDAKANQGTGYAVPLEHDYKNVRVLERDARDVNFEVTGSLEVRGVVADSSNRPVSGAEVGVVQVPGAQTVSGVDGNFTLSGVPYASSGSGTASARFGGEGLRLYAKHARMGNGYSDPLPMTPGTEIPEVRIVLDGFSSLRGTVVDSGGAPVAGARVVLRDQSMGTSQEQQTDGSGAFFFQNVSNANPEASQFRGTHVIEAHHENYASLVREIRIEPGGEQSIQLQLEGGGQIAGRVLDMEGQPLGGARVTARGPMGEERAALSGGDGVYVIQSLPQGQYDITYRLDTNPPLTGALYQVPSGSNNVDIMLQPGEWRVTGTAFDAAENRPLGYYTMNVEGTPSVPGARRFVESREVNTPDGTFQITLTEPGLYRFRFNAPGYHPADQAVKISPETLQLQYINPRLEPVQTFGNIAGSLNLPEGLELAGVNVLGMQSFASDGNAFFLEGLPAGKHDLVFYARQSASGAIQPVGVLPSVIVSENNTTNLGAINSQILRTAYRN